MKKASFSEKKTNFVVLKINFEYPLKTESMLPLLIKNTNTVNRNRKQNGKQNALKTNVCQQLQLQKKKKKTTC